MLSLKQWPRLLAIILVVSPSLAQANTTTSNHNHIDTDKTSQRHPPKHELRRANRRLQRQRIHDFTRSSLSVYIRCVGNNGVSTLQRPYVPCKRGDRGTGRPSTTNTGNDNLYNNNNVIETSPKIYTRGGSSLGSSPGSPPSASPPSSTLDGAATKPPQSATHHDLIQTGETLGGVEEGDQYGYSVQITSDSSGQRFIAIGSNKYSMIGGERGTCCTGKIQAFQLTFNGPNGSESWSSHGQNLFGESPSMEFGAAVSISNDGNVLSGAGRLYTSLYRFNADASRWHEFVYEQKMPGIIMPHLSRDGRRMVARTHGNAVTFRGYMGADISPNWKPLGRSGLVGTIAGVISGHGKRMVTVTSQYTINTYRYEPTQNYLNQVGQVLYLENPNSNTILNNNHVSLAMSLVGDIFAVSYKNNVRAYRFKNRQWSLIAEEIQGSYLDKGGYGYDISVSDRGSRIAIGSPFYNNYKGRVEVYHVYREVWTKICDTIEGEEMGAYAGHAVSIAPDGYHVAVGSPFIGSSSHVGNVRVYELKPLFTKAPAAPAPAPAPAQEKSDGTTQLAGDNANVGKIDDAATLNNNDGDTNQVAKNQMEHAIFDGNDQDNASNDGFYNKGTSNNNGVEKEEKITVSNIYSFFKDKLFGG